MVHYGAVDIAPHGSGNDAGAKKRLKVFINVSHEEATGSGQPAAHGRNGMGINS